MKRALFICLLICTLSAAMVPRLRRSSESKGLKFCAASTPCGWLVYEAVSRTVVTSIDNTYCVCKSGTRCETAEDDVSSSVYVQRCTTTQDTTS